MMLHMDLPLLTQSRSRELFGALMVTLGLIGVCSSVEAEEVQVSDAASLRSAISDASAGDVISLAPGRYEVDGNLATRAAGQMGSPITVRGPTDGEARILFFRSDGGYVEGFKVEHRWWRFEGLVLEGTCSEDSFCEHAWHVAGDADHLVIQGNVALNFNAHIKSNIGPSGQFPDDVLVAGNEFYSDAVRQTSNPVTPIDVVGGRRWIIRGNFIHDFGKGQGNGISYAAFLKGNSRDGLIEKNLVACNWLHSGQIRLGLSFGGGGSAPDRICEDETCSPEHQNGMMRNNIIINCPQDVGVFVRECQGCVVAHNTLFGTTGIDFLEGSVGEAVGNLLMGRIRARDTASVSQMDNIAQVSEADMLAWFVAPARADFALQGDGSEFVDGGAMFARVDDDYCGNPRQDGAHDPGAVEYGDSVCDTTSPLTQDQVLDGDAGMNQDAQDPEDSGQMMDVSQTGEDITEADVGQEDVEVSPDPVPDLGNDIIDDAGDGRGADQEGNDGAEGPTANSPSDDEGCQCAAVGTQRQGGLHLSAWLLLFGMFGLLRKRPDRVC